MLWQTSLPELEQVNLKFSLQHPGTCLFKVESNLQLAVQPLEDELDEDDELEGKIISPLLELEEVCLHNVNDGAREPGGGLHMGSPPAVQLRVNGRLHGSSIFPGPH